MSCHVAGRELQGITGVEEGYFVAPKPTINQSMDFRDLVVATMIIITWWLTQWWKKWHVSETNHNILNWTESLLRRLIARQTGRVREFFLQKRTHSHAKVVWSIAPTVINNNINYYFSVPTHRQSALDDWWVGKVVQSLLYSHIVVEDKCSSFCECIFVWEQQGNKVVGTFFSIQFLCIRR